MMQQHQEGTATTGTSSTNEAGATRGSRVMDSRLRPWALYDLSGAQKGVEGVEYGALQESWCAFIWRWNRMVEEDDSFVGWLVYREEIIKDHSLSELRERVCSGAGKTCAASATKLGLVRLDHIRDVVKEVGARLPRIFLRREAGPSYLIVGHRERGHDDVWRGEEDPRGQQCVQRSSGCLQQRHQQEMDRHAGNARVLAGQDEDDLLNRYCDIQQELDEALDQAARATGETAQLRQSNREILARVRMLERSVHGQLQTGTQPRDPAPGTDGSMVRRARREGRPTHAPAHEAEPTLES
ncbi:hypothetical protein PC118_g23149 [Phytophthora cactorum]|uniref:Uncharacterized protein n=2 Tax=Phytophthora cactorum TaxID=29920 RepID=A0A8T1ERA8_9STRA|nr:hypothetical protein PC118_g23149 [Phytophthora cactorum]